MMNSMQADSTYQEDPNGQDTSQLRAHIEKVNIAEELDEDKLEEISKQVKDGFDADMRSREDWEKNLDEWTNLALQVKEIKNFPWRGASNVKYPLLSTASMQFNARAYPSLVPSTGNLVKAEIIGKDLDGSKLERARRVSAFMSYQILNEMEGWEEDMDKLLIMLPIIGVMFKKTYYNQVLEKNVSELILPKDLVVDYWAKSLESAERVSQIIRLNKRQVKERKMSGLYLDVDLGDPQPAAFEDSKGEILQDSTLPYEIVEQHTYFDLDGDEYAEPYIITFERITGKILRIVARFDDTSIKLNDEGDLAQIVPIQYFTKFPFIPNPDGGFYDIGFGLLLSPLNESVNTLINQLIDAGTLSNLQGGFLGKGLKLKMGDGEWRPGEWKTVQTTADDIKKQVLPLPAKEPSKVLFELMGTLVTSGKELASVAEIFVGKMPGQNTPATTTMATIEQGMKVFTAVYKRIYRALKSEYKKLYKLNNMYLNPEKYINILDQQVDQNDFEDKSYDICPSADPSTPTQTEKLMKAQGLLELLPIGILDPLEVVRRVLDAQEQPAIERLFNQQVQQTGQFQPPPDPKQQEMEMKMKLEQQKAAMDVEQKKQEMELNARDKQMQMMQKAQEHQMKMQQTVQSAQIESAAQVHKQRIFQAQEASKNQQQMAQADQQHQQTMQHSQEKASLAQDQMRQKAKIQTSSSRGKPTQSQKR